ncbi:MAG: cytochrome c [bacterium]|nr:cytochrome c [bacterium]
MKIEIYLDDESEPRAIVDPPAPFDLDTSDLTDGRHVLRLRALEDEGPAGVHEIPFTVRNGPGIAVVGMAKDEIVQGRVPILVNAYASRVGDVFEPDRAETPAPVPTWAWVLCLLVAAWAMWYLASTYQEHATKLAQKAPSATQQGTKTVAQTPEGEPEWKALGAQLFGNYCSSCHQLSGTGVPGVFPPLKGDAVVTAQDPKAHIRIVLYGLKDKSIDGVAYASPMPAFGKQLRDKDVAAVVNHERRSWGNNAPTVTWEDVAAQRTP